MEVRIEVRYDNGITENLFIPQAEAMDEWTAILEWNDGEILAATLFDEDGRVRAFSGSLDDLAALPL